MLANAAGAAIVRRVGHRIAELRAARGWTQEAFAERLGVSPQYIRAVERGSENLTLGTLVALADELHVHPSALLVAPNTMRAKPGRPARRRQLPFAEIEPEARQLFIKCVPLVTLEASAGNVGEPHAVEVARWVVPRSRSHLAPGMFIARVVGDSMEPSVPNGSWCLFRSPATEVDGKTVLVQRRDADDPENGGAYTLKKVERRRLRSGLRVRLISQNKSYAPIDVTADGGERYAVIAELIEVLE